MALDSRVRWVVRFGGLRPTDVSVPIPVRRSASAGISALGARFVIRQGDDPAKELELMVPVQGGEIRVRLLVPHGPGPHPLYVFIHGGGWTGGTLQEREGRCRMITAGAKCITASIDYRLAPENQFPTAPEDCYAALCALVERADELGIDTRRVAIGGESAGGNLAAAVCLMAIERGGPEIIYQWLDVPALDCTKSQEGHRNVPDGYLLDADLIDDFLYAYLPNEADHTHPLASPLFADDAVLAKVPEAWIMTTENDKLRGDGAAYADKLASLGVPVRHERLAGHIHLTFAFTKLIPSAAAYEDRAIAALADAFRRAKA